MARRGIYMKWLDENSNLGATWWAIHMIFAWVLRVFRNGFAKALSALVHRRLFSYSWVFSGRPSVMGIWVG